MRETYEFLCTAAGQTPRADWAAKVTSIGEAVFDATPLVRPDAKHVLAMLQPYYHLVLFTAGDERVQQVRIEQSNLAVYFQTVRITAKKTLESWEQLVKGLGWEATTTWSVGNSVRSDINPALKLGMPCIIIAARTWEYERTPLFNSPAGSRAWQASSLTEAAEIVMVQDGLAVGSVKAAIRRNS
jgi:putative hydrolase of the HAD superfamily